MNAARRFTRNISTIALLAVYMTAAAQEAAAQDAAATQTDQVGVAEIVVTAQKREQNLQDVPIAVTALTQQALETNRVTNVTDLTGLAPGLVATESSGSQGAISYAMRGIIANSAAIGSDKEISTYLDGVYIGSVRGAIFDIPDVQRIEVLRGPQGTLFGRNATAGAVSVITRDPTGKAGARQEFTVGNYDQFRTRTSIDLPAFGPFSAYVSFVNDKRRGDTRNLGAGTVWDRSAPNSGFGIQTSPKWLGSKDQDSWFAALKFEPTSDFKMTYKFDSAVNHFTPDARSILAINPNNPTGQLILALLATQPPGGGPWGPNVLVPSGERPKALNNAFAVPGTVRNSGHNLTTEWRVSDSVSLKNITAYRKTSSALNASDLAGVGGLVITPALAGLIPSFAPAVGSHFLVYEGNNAGKAEQWSTEFQLNYDSELLTLTTGAMWYHSKELFNAPPGTAPNYIFAVVPANGQLPLGGEIIDRNKTTSIAAYAQAEVHVTPKINIVGGARITRDKKSGTHSFGDTFIPTPSGERTEGSFTDLTVIPFTYKKTKPNFSIGANYKPNSDILVYGKFSTGFVSGGSVGGVAFSPETVRSWEAGLKADLLDRRLRTNLALWVANYKHLQTSQGGAAFGRPDLPVLVVNAGTVKAKGAELEITAAPLAGVTLGGSGGYTDTKLANPPPFLTDANFGHYVLSQIPKWTANLYGQYETPPLFGDARLNFRVDANWRSKIRLDPDPNIAVDIPIFAPYEFQPSRWVVNARVALQDIDIGPGHVDVALWTRNLTNDKSIAFPVGFGPIFRSADFVKARTYGMDLIFTF